MSRDRDGADVLRDAVRNARQVMNLHASLRRLDVLYADADERRRKMYVTQMQAIRVLILDLVEDVCPKCCGTKQIAVYPARGEISYVRCKDCLTPKFAKW